MDVFSINYSDFRLKTTQKINNYLHISKNNQISIGLYREGKVYILGNLEEENCFRYDIGSISKTLMAHLILKLENEGKLNLNHRIDKYLPLKSGNYPTIYQLLTHTAGYHHLTPVEITVPKLLFHSYARKNPYINCTNERVIKCLEKRRFLKPSMRYGYSDFSYAILAVVAQKVANKPFDILFEEFVQKDLGLKNTTIREDENNRIPPAANGKKIIPFWEWNRNNPYLASGGMVSNLKDILSYISMQIESKEQYITLAHKICKESQIKNSNHLMCIGWHTYKRSNQIWHVGGVGTFRSSVILNKKLKLGVVVLGNAKGRGAANVHYIAKMLYSELKKRKVNFN